jgi:beta-barrel assembly-enhancing protease
MKQWLALLLAFAAMPATAAPKAETIAAYRALAAQDGRVATIGYRLAEANAPFCQTKSRNPGWVLNGIAQFDDNEAAAAAFGFDRWYVNIVALVPDGPAAKAGLSVGDVMISLPDTRWDQKMHVLPDADAEGMEQLRQTLNAMWAEKGAVEIVFEAGETRKAFNFAPPEICASDFWVDTRTKIDAGADGDRVRVTSGLVSYVPDDQELAAVIAHELAHNLLGHRARLEGIKKGKTKAILATEEEADRLSVWLMANAGYDPKAAQRFWERYGKQYGLGIFSAATHHRWKKRVAMMQVEIDLILRTVAKDSLRDPPLLSIHRNQQ